MATEASSSSGYRHLVHLSSCFSIPSDPHTCPHRQQGHPHTPNSPPEELASSQGKKDPPEPPGAGKWHLSALLTSGHCGSQRPAEQGERKNQESAVPRPTHTHTHPTLVPKPSHRQQTSGDK